MSKFAKGDHVRVTATEHEKFDQVGVVDYVFKDGRHWAYSVRFGILHMPIFEHHLILAIPPITEVLDQMGAESAPSPTAGLEKLVTEVLKASNQRPRKDMAEMEIDGDYVRGKGDPVNAPSRYRSHPSGIETITITRHESFLRGNVLKYVLRAPYKSSEVEDLKKAAQYLQWEIERAESAQ